MSEAQAAGWDVLITCTLRSNEAQTALYASGRTAKGRILTNARAGESKHNPDKVEAKSKAFDFVIMKHGKCDWNDLEGYRKLGEIGERLGLKWAGRWRGKLKELVHFEID